LDAKAQKEKLDKLRRFLKENNIIYRELDDVINTVGEGIYIPSSSTVQAKQQ